MLIDLHVHAAPRGPSLEGLLARGPVAGLDGAAVVGEDAFADVRGRRGREELALFAGAQVTTDRGLYLVFVPEPDRLPPLDQLFGPRVDGTWPVRDVLARARALGGAVGAAHPYDLEVFPPGGDILFTLPHLTAIEAVFAGRPPTLSYPAVEAAETLGLPCVGGSGARAEGEVGRAATLFAGEVRDEAGLVEALQSGACWPVELSAPPRELLRRSSSAHPGGPTAAPRDGASPQRRRAR